MPTRRLIFRKDGSNPAADLFTGDDQNVRIVNCHIETADDCIVLKTSGAYRSYGPTENVVISGCTLESTSAAVKFGSESESDFRNIIVNNCCIYRTNRAVSFQLRDEGNIENVDIGNLNIETRAFSEHYWGQGEAVCMTAVPRHTGGRTGIIRKVRIHDLNIRGECGIFLCGNEAQPIENTELKDITMTLAKTSRWPADGYDLRPCDGESFLKTKIYGVYADYTDGLTLSALHISAEDSFLPYYGGTVFTGSHCKQ